MPRPCTTAPSEKLSYTIPTGLLLLAYWAIARTAFATNVPRVHLSYDRGPGAEACEDSETLRRNVALRLGYNAFLAPATETLKVHVVREANGLTADIELVDIDGSSLGERRLTSHSEDCLELTAAIELAVSIAIDPLSQGRAPSLEEPPAATSRATETRPLAPPPQTHPDDVFLRKPRFDIAAGAVGVAGSEPSVSAGFTAEISARWLKYSLGIEGRADLPASGQVGGQGVQSALLMGSVVPCYRLGTLGGCLLFSGGLRDSTQPAGTTTVHSAIGPFAGAGLRALFDLPLTDLIALRFHVEGLVTVIKETLFEGASPPWVPPTLSASAGMAVVFHLP